MRLAQALAPESSLRGGGFSFSLFAKGPTMPRVRLATVHPTSSSYSVRVGGVPPRLAAPGMPTYDLGEVQRVARLAIVHWYRAARLVGMRLGVSDPVAEALVRRKLLALRSGSFVRPDLQRHEPPVWADIYGLDDEDGGWFIKLAVIHGRVRITSCHGPERDLVCVDGAVIREQRP